MMKTLFLNRRLSKEGGKKKESDDKSGRRKGDRCTKGEIVDVAYIGG